MAKEKPPFERNRLYRGNNLEILATLPEGSVDLIYIDPPFFSNRNYEIIWGDEAEIRSFEDRWEGGINVYVEWMRERVFELHRVLKPTGSMYLHCDYHASHYLKIMMDGIFGDQNFRNEIIWNKGFRGTESQRIYQHAHDTIFFYTKHDDYIWNQQHQPYKDLAMKRYNKIDSEGNRYALIKRHRTDRTIYYGKTYPKAEGKRINDVIDIPTMAATSSERLGYPTQKPEALLERIIKASSNKGDVVLDAFCGCGTAMVAAEKLGRRWIGIDISPSAIALVKQRLAGSGAEYDVIGMPTKAEELKQFKPYEFQYWVVNEMHGTGSDRKSGDMGIDGFSFLKHLPIQVKQSEGVGRNVVDNFETALRRHYPRQKEYEGYIVAFSFTKGSYEEAARAKKDGFTIHLVTVQDILDRKFSLLPTA